MRAAGVFALLLMGCGGGQSAGDGVAVGDVTTAFAPSKAEFSAGFFVEAYCSGCHQSGYSAPSGRQVALFTKKSWWTEPFQSTTWFEELDYDEVVKWGDAIRCGVAPDALPDGCTTLSNVPAGFFTHERKFPPSGDTSSAAYGATPPPICAYAADGHTCPQPSDHERAAMVDWIVSGFPR
jgi:hypothetical protein